MAREHGRLLRISIELSRECNLRCPYCWVEGGKRLPNELSLSEIFSILDQAKQLGARTVSIHGGEPLLYKDFFKVIDYINAKNMVGVVFTNGTLITPEVAQKLFDKNVSIIAKRNSLKPEIQDKLVGGISGVHNKMWEGIQDLIDVGFSKTNPPRLSVESIISKDNYDEIPELYRWMRREQIIPYFELIKLQGRACEHSELDISPGEAKSLFYKLLKIDQEEFGYTWIPSPSLVGFHCNWYYYYCYVTAQGKVLPCPGVPLSQGNLTQERLEDILNKDFFRKVRHMHENIKGKCRTCKYLKECYGCRGIAYSVRKDPFAEDPICWH